MTEQHMTLDDLVKLSGESNLPPETQIVVQCEATSDNYHPVTFYFEPVVLDGVTHLALRLNNYADLNNWHDEDDDL